MASQTTADGRILPPLNINNPAPTFDLNNFTFAHGIEPKIAMIEDGLNDNTLIANLTTEQWTFGPTLGNILNRGFANQNDINITGLAYMQTV
ncbi:hypothetical protein OQA88_8979 [Cercophora sp. LCS_1]